MQIVARDAIGVPSPVGRAKLALKTVPVLVHYTGANGYTDPKQDLNYAKSVAAYGVKAGKTFEYNYLIGLGGTVYTQAGEYRGAHCLNFNDKSYGILFMNGIGVAPSEAQIQSFHDLREYLVSTSQIHPAHIVVPHYRYRATSCPGLALAEKPGARWASPTGEGSLGQLIPALISRPKPQRPVLFLGYSGPLVNCVQVILNERSGSKLAIDGVFGAETAQAWNNVCLYVNQGQQGPWPIDSEISGKDWDLLAVLDGWSWNRLLFCGFPPAAQ